MLELFGPSSAGKSSLAARLVRPGDERSYELVQDWLLGRFGLGWLRGAGARRLAVDLIAAAGVVVTWREGGPYYRWALRQVVRLEPARLYLRVNLLRNAWKGASLRLLAPRLARRHDRLLMDEGPLQTANYLLVNVHHAPDRAALEEFLRVVPVPDEAAYLRAPAAELVERTLRRSHARVPGGSRSATEAFVSHALAVFDRVAAEPRVRARLCAPEGLA